MKNVIIEGKVCHIEQKGTGGPCIFWGTMDRGNNEIAVVVDDLKQREIQSAYTLLIYEVMNWNRDFSPWRADAVYGDEDFSGGGDATLLWLQNQCIPYLQAEKIISKDTRYLLTGYSLAGLFSLWSFYESDLFTGVASCSGSLWFPGWTEYMRTAMAPSDSIVYLSLGGREEKTKNSTVSVVGDVTRNMEGVLQEDPDVLNSVLEWNTGGHFSDPAGRIVKGIQWLLEHVDKDHQISST